jgi:ABC-type uncharacterized transport system substrate-binding protein
VLRSALQWYARDLMPQLTTKISIELNIVANLVRDEQMDAAVTWLEDPVKPRQFVMEVDADLDLDRTLEMLAHEMVHVKQFAFGELIDNPSGKTVKWQGKRVSVRDDDGYWTLPWEIEAYGRQPGLFARFCRHKGI